MALIAIASDKGAPGVTTAALALAAVWPRPVLLAECDPAGGDLVYRFPAADGGHLDPRRGVLSLAVVARRGMQPQQVWEHVQKLHGGLDVLAGVTNAEQGAGLSLLWGPIGKALAALPQADVIADCGRLGADGPLYDLLIEATTVVLVSKVQVADVIRLRDRAAAFAAAAQTRGRRGFGVGVVVVAEHKKFRAALGEMQHVLGQANAPATVLGGIAHDTKGADLLGGEWGGNLDRTMLIKTAREVAQQLAQGLPPIGEPDPAQPAYPSGAHAAQPAPGIYPAPPAPAGRRHAALQRTPSDPQPAAAFSGPQPAASWPSPAASAFPGPPAPEFSGVPPVSSFSAGPAGAFAEPPPASSFSSPPASAFSGPAASEFSSPQAAFPSAAGAGSPGQMPAGPWQANPEAGRPDTGRPQPVPAGASSELAAATLSAPVPPVPAAAKPPVSPDAPRTTFSRILGGRSGRHQADSAQAASGPDQSRGASPAGQAGQPRQYVADPFAAYPATQYPADQAGPAQAGPAQAGPAQAGAPQPGPPQPGPNQAAPGQPGPGQAGPGQAGSPQLGSSPMAPPQQRPARHAAPDAGGPGNGSAYSRAPMPPLVPPIGPADLGDQENPEDGGWGAAPWQRQGPMSRPGGE